MNDTTAGFLADLLVRRPSVPRGLDWAEVGRTTGAYRLGGLAWSLFEGAPVPADLGSSWEAAYREQALVWTLLAEEWERLRELLAREGVDARLVKGGWLLSQGLYAPGERALDDIDLVIPRTHAPEVIRILAASGWEPWDRDPASTVGWATAATFQPRGPARHLGVSVDVHWSLEYGGLRARAERDSGRAEQPKARDFGPEDQLTLVVEHVLKHLRYRTHLSGLADIARLLSGPLEVDGVARRLGESRWGRAGCRLLEAVEDRLHPDGRPGAGRRRPRPRTLERLVSGAEERRGRVSGLGDRWAMLGPGGAVRDLADVCCPPASWLRARYGSAGEPGARGLRLHHLTRVLRWSLGRGPSPLSTNQGVAPRV